MFSRRKTVWWLVLLTQILSTHSSNLNSLIKKINDKSQSSTVLFVGVDNDYVSSFMKSELNIPVVTFDNDPSDKLGGEKSKCYSNTILVLTAPKCFNSIQWKNWISKLCERKFVIIHSESLENLQNSFEFFATNKFVGIFGLTKLNTFAYLPFAKHKIEIIFENSSLPNSLENLNGLKFRAAIKFDVPRAFLFVDENGHRHLEGLAGKLFISFLQKYNGTFEEVFIENIDTIREINGIKNGQIDVSICASNPTQGIQMSYPLEMIKWTIMVPVNGHLDPNQYFTRPFSSTVWSVIGLTIVYIVFMEVVMNYGMEQPSNIWYSFSRTILTMLRSPISAKPRFAYIFHSQVHLFAFIIGNLYVIYLTSYLTVFIKIPQLNTLQDLVDNNITVMMSHYDWRNLSHPQYYPKGFEKIVFEVNNTILNAKRTSMSNTEFAYAIGNDAAEFLINLQRKFSKPKFRMIREHLECFFFGFVFEEHSVFLEILNEHILRVLATGLVDKWTDDAVLRGIPHFKEMYQSQYLDDRTQPALTWHHLIFAWNCLRHGLAVAIVVYVFEILYARAIWVDFRKKIRVIKNLWRDVYNIEWFK
ncbi:uncharacterized protein LOC129910884 [Episyrphus balteatus]|uniref:uncharacterized protein LOC129910884 n=1 Tax=Episyrphus balteatus TaxID=286459 RepID=UPI0024850C0D|nr:uncharacterized protein LOC129910884 [Episyrphus balteatus]